MHRLGNGAIRSLLRHTIMRDELETFGCVNSSQSLEESLFWWQVDFYYLDIEFSTLEMA